MKKIFSSILFFVISLTLTAQNVGIGTNMPDEKLQVDSVIRVGKNQIIAAGTTRKNLIKFGDADFVTIGEQNKDDRLVMTAASFAFKNGNVGIGIDSAREALDVNGAIVLNNSNGNVEGALRYNAAMGDLEFRDNNTWNSTKNKFLTKTSYFFEDANRNIIVDVPGSDLLIADAGTYLVNYYVDAYNTFQISGAPSFTIDKFVFRTDVYLFEKNSSVQYQRMRIDILEAASGGTAAAGTPPLQTFTLPAHEVSGIAVMQLTANSKIGIKIKQTTALNGFGAMRINEFSITAVKLY